MCTETRKNVMIKLSITDGLWHFEDLGATPYEMWQDNGTENLGGEPGDRTVYVTEPIAGKFKYFYYLKGWGNRTWIPRYIWVYDPDAGKWKNISKGPNYNNLTGSSCRASCGGLPTPYDSCRTGPSFYLCWRRG